MSYATNHIFDSTELSAITAAESAAEISGSYVTAYQTVIDLITDQYGALLFSADEDMLKFLEAARDINGDTGDYAAFVRAYTEQQYEIRNGVAPYSGFLQDSSNAVAHAVISQIIDDHELPSIETIATRDATVVTDNFFDGDAGAWSGNLLFLAFGYDDAFETNMVPEEHDTYNLLAMCKIVQDFGVFSTVGAFWNDLCDAYSSSHNMLDVGFEHAGDYLAESYGGIGGEVSLGGYTLLYNITLGTTGNDAEIESGEGLALVHGGDGDDTIFGNVADGTSILDGGKGTDTVDFGDLGSGLLFVISGSTDYTSTLIGIAGLGTDTAGLFDLEEVVATGEDDTVQVQDVSTFLDEEGVNKFPLSIDAGDGTDTLDLSALTAEWGADIDLENGELWLNYDDGSVLVDISGFEHFVGSGGDQDQLILDGADVSFDGGDGFDLIRFLEAVDTDSEEFTNIEYIIGSDSDDTITYSHNAVTLWGGAGTDVLTGSDDDDLLSGSDENLTEDGVRDILNGGDGDDDYWLTSDFVQVSQYNFTSSDSDGWITHLSGSISLSDFDGADEIIDSDGEGMIHIGSATPTMTGSVPSWLDANETVYGFVEENEVGMGFFGILDGGNLYLFGFAYNYDTQGEHSVTGTIGVVPFCVVADFNSGDLGWSI